ncbi:hypothetical protein JTB14_001000 [Gonioctena quinquepunctata]|nr:hypothetical protein JTB14_001000 [Gonioctena quinquepunctata]
MQMLREVKFRGNRLVVNNTPYTIEQLEAKERREEKKPLSAPPTPRQKLPEVPDQEKKEETVIQTETVAHQLEIGESQKNNNIVTPKTGTAKKILNQNPPEKKEQMEKLRIRSQNKLL